jgi:hypothetical protein
MLDGRRIWNSTLPPPLNPGCCHIAKSYEANFYLLNLTYSFHAVVKEKYSQFEFFLPFMDKREKSF